MHSSPNPTKPYHQPKFEAQGLLRDRGLLQCLLHLAHQQSETRDQEHPSILLALAIQEQTRTVTLCSDVKIMSDLPLRAAKLPTVELLKTMNVRSENVLSYPAWVRLRMLSAITRGNCNMQARPGSHSRTSLSKRILVQGLDRQTVCIPCRDSWTVKWCVIGVAHKFTTSQKKLGSFIAYLFLSFIRLPFCLLCRRDSNRRIIITLQCL